MPPRFPHGLKKPPTDMSVYEKAVFAALGTSIGIGVYQLATSPWCEEAKNTESLENKSSSWKEFLMSACPVKFTSSDEPSSSKTTTDASNATNTFSGNAFSEDLSSTSHTASDGNEQNGISSSNTENKVDFGR